MCVPAGLGSCAGKFAEELRCAVFGEGLPDEFFVLGDALLECGQLLGE